MTSMAPPPSDEGRSAALEDFLAELERIEAEEFSRVFADGAQTSRDAARAYEMVAAIRARARRLRRWIGRPSQDQLDDICARLDALLALLAAAVGMEAALAMLVALLYAAARLGCREAERRLREAGYEAP